MSDELRALARDALEAARVEVVRRLGERGLPTSVEARQLLVIDNDDLTGWRSASGVVRRSSLTVDGIEDAVTEEWLGFRTLGVQSHLEPFARALASETPLGTYTPRGGSRREDATEHALISYALRMAFAYLRSLQDVAEGDDQLLDRLLDELAVLVERGVLWQRGQLALDGVRLTSALRPHRNVTLRSLSPAERGRWVEARSRFDRAPMLADFVVPFRWEHFTPRVVLDWLEEVEAGAGDDVGLHRRLALAFFLRGHDIASTGGCVQFGDPRWASFGVGTVPVPVEPRPPATPPAPIDQQEFAAVVDLAFSMPPFGPEETTREEVVLHRVLRGCGAARPVFLDLATALEAALLEGARTELAYRFRLYGALFLAPERDSEGVAGQLKEVYEVRSRLVHGTPVPAARLRAAEATARTLSTAVTRKAIETGWPEREALDKVALRT